MLSLLLASFTSALSFLCFENQRWNPRLYKTTTPNGTVRYFSVCAVGSVDASLSLWSSCRPSPLLYLHGFFSEDVVDLDWSADGSILVASSHDGTVCLLKFDVAAFEGEEVTQHEMATYLKNLWADALANASSHSTSASAGITALNSFESNQTYQLVNSAKRRSGYQRSEKRLKNNNKHRNLDF